MLTNNNATMQSTSAMTAPPPWALFSWPTVFCQQTLWAQHLDDGEAGLAWDWVEVAHGVVAMADPMGVATNLRLVGSAGQVLAAHEAAMTICRWVRQIPWQDEVWRALRAA